MKDNFNPNYDTNQYLVVIMVDVDKKKKHQNRIILKKIEEFKNQISIHFASNPPQVHFVNLYKNDKEIEDMLFYPITNLKKGNFEDKYENHKSKKQLFIDILKNEGIDIVNDLKIINNIINLNSLSICEYFKFFQKLENIIND